MFLQGVIVAISVRNCKLCPVLCACVKVLLDFIEKQGRRLFADW
jgi:hypothetical protein